METVETMRHFMHLARMTREEALEQLYFIELATREVERRMRPGSDAYRPAALYAAAAALAYYRYTLAASADSVSFKAGDVSVTENGTRAAFARKTAEAAFAAAAPLLVDDGFLFAAVGADGKDDAS